MMSTPSLPPPALDTNLLDGAIEGDAEAWRLLHRRYFRMAASFLRELGVHDRDLEDATQEVSCRCSATCRSFGARPSSRRGSIGLHPQARRDARAARA